MSPLESVVESGTDSEAETESESQGESLSESPSPSSAESPTLSASTDFGDFSASTNALSSAFPTLNPFAIALQDKTAFIAGNHLTRSDTWSTGVADPRLGPCELMPERICQASASVFLGFGESRNVPGSRRLIEWTT
jgi:hypothetical protein